MGNKLNNSLKEGIITEQELGRLASTISPCDITRISVMWLDLNKIEIDRCMADAKISNEMSWHFVFNCLYLWRQKNGEAATHMELFKLLDSAREEGLVHRNSITFLLKEAEILQCNGLSFSKRPSSISNKVSYCMRKVLKKAPVVHTDKTIQEPAYHVQVENDCVDKFAGELCTSQEVNAQIHKQINPVTVPRIDSKSDLQDVPICQIDCNKLLMKGMTGGKPEEPRSRAYAEEVYSRTGHTATVPVNLIETDAWDPDLQQLTMCQIDYNKLAIRGVIGNKPEELHGHEYVLDIYSRNGHKLNSWPSRCRHDWSMGLQHLFIEGMHYIAESCPECHEIRLYTKQDGYISVAFNDKNANPGKMCLGPEGLLLVYDKQNKNVLKLNCSKEKFYSEGLLDPMITHVNGMCYVKSNDLLVLTTQIDHTIKAIDFSRGTTRWCLKGRVAHRWLHPWDVRFDSQSGYLFAADGKEKRILLISVLGEIIQTLLKDELGAIYRLVIFDSQPRLVVRDSYPNHMFRTYNIHNEEKYTPHYPEMAHLRVY